MPFEPFSQIIVPGVLALNKALNPRRGGFQNSPMGWNGNTPYYEPPGWNGNTPYYGSPNQSASGPDAGAMMMNIFQGLIAQGQASAAQNQFQDALNNATTTTATGGGAMNTSGPYGAPTQLAPVQMNKSFNIMDLIRDPKVQSNPLLEPFIANSIRGAQYQKFQEGDPYTLGSNDERYNGNNQRVATGMPIQQRQTPVNSEWQAELDAKGQPVMIEIPGTKTKRVKEFKYQTNPVTNKVEKIYRTAAGGTEVNISPWANKADQRMIMTYQNSFNADPAIKTYKDQGLSLEAVNGIIEEARKGNKVSASALGVKMAKTMGEVGMLSESDVTRYVQAKSLSRAAADKLTKWINGVPTSATLDDIREISDVMRNRFTGAIQPVIDIHIQQMMSNLGLTEEEAYNYLGARKLVPGADAKPAGRKVPTEVELNQMTDEQLKAYLEGK